MRYSEFIVRLWRLLLPALTAALWLPAAALADDAVPILRSAQALLQRQDWKAAAAGFESALQLTPLDAGAHFGLALARRGAGDLPGAIGSANTALRLRPAFDEARLALGLMLQQRGDAAAAIVQYKLVLARDPRSAQAHNWLGVAYMQKNQLADAATAFRAAIRLQPDFVRAHNNLGSTLAQAGDLQAGIEAFQAGLRYAPADLQLRLNLGTALRTKGEPEAAIREFETVLRENPDNHEVHHQLGLALREKGDLDAALRSFETALRLNPEYREGYYVLSATLKQMAASARRAPGASQPEAAEAHQARGLALGRAGDLRGAGEELTKAVALRPAFAEAQFNLGAALWYSGDKAKAGAALDAAIRLDPALAPAYGLRGIALRDSGDLDSGQRLLQRALALQPDLPHAYFDLGVLFLRRQEMPSALGQFEAGLNLPAPAGPLPDLDIAIRELRAAAALNSEAHHILGRMLGLAGAPADAVAAAFSSAIRLQPDFAEAHNNLGLVYLQSGDDPRAIAAFREAIRHRPDFAGAHANLGATLTATSAVESVTELEKAVALQPGLLRAQFNLAIAYGSSPKHGTVQEIAQLRKVLALDANYPRASFSLGKALLRGGKIPEAVSLLERAAQLEPGFGEALYQLGLALTRAGRAGEAAERLRAGRELIAAARIDETVLLDMKEGKAALDSGAFDLALAKFRQALREKPGLAEAHYHLGLTLARKGDSTASAAAFRQTLELDPRHRGAQQALAAVPHYAADDPPPSPYVSPLRPSGDADLNRLAELETFIRDGKFIEVQPLLEQYLKERPNSSRGWYTLGYTLFGQRKIGESIGALAKSLALDGTNAEAHKVLGRNLMLIGRFDVARSEFELGEKYDPRSAEMPFNLGRLFSIQDQWAAARAAFERALKIDPLYPEAVDGLGFALEALGEDSAAIAQYRKAAALNEARRGSFATPLINLSAYFNRTGETAAAIEHARQAVAVNEKADRAWFQMARAHERAGELDKALEALSRAIAINSRSSSYYYVLGTVYRRLGKSQESRDAMEMFSKLDRESNDLERRRRESLRPEGPKP